MKKVLIFCFLFLLFTCARKTEDRDLSLIVHSSQLATPTDINLITTNDTISRVKVYIENTLSMYGYLPNKKEKNTDFRNAVNELLIVSKGTYNKDNVEFYLVNNEATVTASIDNNLDDIDVSSLTRNYSKGRGNSDFDKLFRKVLQDWNQDEVIVFIADFIYSPSNTEVVSGLNRLRQNITKAFQEAEGSESLAVNILHLESDFHGSYYYDNDNEAVSGINKRPYYMFIIGNKNNLKEYSKQVVPQLARYNLKNDYNLSSSEDEIDDYSALPYTLNIGQFEAKSNSIGNSQIKSVIVKNSLTHVANVQLAITVNLRDIPVFPEYLMDTDNYQLNDSKIELIDIGLIDSKKIQLRDGSEEVIKSNDIAKIGNASHAFLVSFPSTYKGSLKLSLKKSIPEWVNDVSINVGEDDRDIKTNVLKQSQTFGFNYIVEGIYDAQRLKNSKNEYFRIALDIDQNKSGSGIGAIIGWLIALVIIGIIIAIILRNKRRK